MKNFKLLIYIEIIIILSICVIHKQFQNDTFFTIANGRTLIDSGFQEYDTLSWHENLKFTNARYLFDLIITGIYEVTGFKGIYAFTCLVTVIIGLTYFVILRLLTRKQRQFEYDIYDGSINYWKRCFYG